MADGPNDKAHEDGVHDGQRGGFLDDLIMGTGLGDIIPGNQEEWDSYKAGYEYGSEHRYGPDGRYHSWDGSGTNDSEEEED
ncbi:MAG: hypothetical protein V1866_01885 [archaeon]